jgi:hypothetical protein
MERRANWRAAEVEATAEGYVLKVPLEGESSPDWEDAFRRVVEAHRHEVWGGRWGHIRHGLDELRVEHVREGFEERLREFLDDCSREAHEHVRQDAADRREDEAAAELRRTEASHEFEPTGGAHQAAAERMTERLRGTGS